MSDDQWTIPTIKQYFEAQFKAIGDKIDLKFQGVNNRFDARDKALELQALDNKEHFDRLNHEAARILKAAETTVSRDTWDGFQKEYQNYKEQTEKSLQGRSLAVIIQMISSVASIAAIIGVILGLFEYEAWVVHRAWIRPSATLRCRHEGPVKGVSSLRDLTPLAEGLAGSFLFLVERCSKNIVRTASLCNRGRADAGGSAEGFLCRSK